MLKIVMLVGLINAWYNNDGQAVGNVGSESVPKLIGVVGDGSGPKGQNRLARGKSHASST